MAENTAEPERRRRTAARDANRLPSLTGLRFVAAAMVLGFHLHDENMVGASPLRHWWDRVFGSGLTGVSFFFVLSGFVLTWSARPGEPNVVFWRRRAARIWPSHLATAAAMAVVGLSLRFIPRLDPLPTLANLALVQCWKPDQDWYYSLNSPSWSLSCEAFFYLTFPLWHRLLRRAPGWSLLPLVGALVAAVWVVPTVVWALGPATDDTAWWLVYCLPLNRCVEFVLGMALALAVRAGRFPPVPLPVATAVTVGCYLLAPRWLPWPLPIVAGTALGFALLVPAAARADLGGRPTLSGTRLFVWLGERSFALYLVQHVVIRSIRKLLDLAGYRVLDGPGTVAVFAAAFALSLVLAALLHSYVEKPAFRLLAKGRRRAPRPALREATRQPVSSAAR